MRFSKIQRALDSGLFKRALCEVPTPPDKQQVFMLRDTIGSMVSEEHLDLLCEWGGANLEEIRIFPIDRVAVKHRRVVFADDHNRFVFQYDADGKVFAEDTDGGQTKKVAASIQEFIDEIFLGPRAAEHYGEEWLNELRKRKLA